MKGVFFQLLAMGSVLIFLAIEWFTLRFETDKKEDHGEAVWSIQAERYGPHVRSFWSLLMNRRRLQTFLGLSEGCYTVGNRVTDDLYIDASGQTAKLYLNVQKYKMYLTVLKGCISIDGCSYTADRTRRIEIEEYSRVRISDIELQFLRKR